MKQLDSAPLPGFGPKGKPETPCRPASGAEHSPVHGDDFPTCLAEALDILVERAMRHGLVEVAHLLEVAALASRDAAISPGDPPHGPAPEDDWPPSSPA